MHHAFGVEKIMLHFVCHRLRKLINYNHRFQFFRFVPPLILRWPAPQLNYTQLCNYCLATLSQLRYYIQHTVAMETRPIQSWIASFVTFFRYPWRFREIYDSETWQFREMAIQKHGDSEKWRFRANQAQ